MVESATEALQRVNRLLSDQTIRDVGSAVHDLRLTTGEIAAFAGMTKYVHDRSLIGSIRLMAKGRMTSLFLDFAAL